jgi:hypothetical protein
MIMKYLPIIVFPLLLSACSNEDKFDVGYDDGYAAGYNTTCEIRATMVEGDWDNQSYSRGYKKGYETGSQDCKNKN